MYKHYNIWNGKKITEFLAGDVLSLNSFSSSI